MKTAITASIPCLQCTDDQTRTVKLLEEAVRYMLVTEWTRVLCCSGLAQREDGRFRFSFREKNAGLGSVFLTIFSTV